MPGGRNCTCKGPGVETSAVCSGDTGKAHAAGRGVQGGVAGVSAKGQGWGGVQRPVVRTSESISAIKGHSWV